MSRIYADYAATAPLAPGVAAAMAPWLGPEFGNASSLHAEGRAARDAIDQAREVLSARMGCLFAEFLFTGSGTESANLAILGTAFTHLQGSRRRVLLGAAEHHCVLHTRPILEKFGFQVQTIPVDRNACIDLTTLDDLVGEDVLLVSVMHANNEVGTIQPVAEVAALAARCGALFHCDAVQTFGRWSWSADSLGADLVTVSAHKIGGPKGVGGIFVKAGVKPQPLIVGGGQEREMRAGTENVAGIVGFAAALATSPERQGPSGFPAALAFEAAMTGHGEKTIPHDVDKLPGHVHLRFPGIQAETLLIRLDRMGVSASAGAACSSGSLESSHVLLACGYTEAEAREGVRFSFGEVQRAETGAEAAARVLEAVSAIRA